MVKYIKKNPKNILGFFIVGKRYKIQKCYDKVWNINSNLEKN